MEPEPVQAVLPEIVESPFLRGACCPCPTKTLIARNPDEARTPCNHRPADGLLYARWNPFGLEDRCAVRPRRGRGHATARQDGDSLSSDAGRHPHYARQPPPLRRFSPPILDELEGSASRS